MKTSHAEVSDRPWNAEPDLSDERSLLLTKILLCASYPSPAAHPMGARPVTDRAGWGGGAVPASVASVAIAPGGGSTRRRLGWRRGTGEEMPRDPDPALGGSDRSCGAAHYEAACDEGSLGSPRGHPQPVDR
jgi:hypothetical protein